MEECLLDQERGKTLDINTIWSVISIAFFVGGLTMGYYASRYKQDKEPSKVRGFGRWDLRTVLAY